MFTLDQVKKHAKILIHDQPTVSSLTAAVESYPNNKTEEYESGVVIAVVADQVSNGTVKLFATANGVQTLKLNTFITGHVENVRDKFKIYEGYVPYTKTETYLVEMEDCIGNAELYVSRNFHSLIEGDFDVRSSRTKNGKMYAELKQLGVYGTPYMIAVKSTNNHTQALELYNSSTFRI